MKKLFVYGMLAAALGLVALIGLFRLIPSDEFTQSYETYAAAKADRLFERGWVPEIIPESATMITFTGDLDMNTGDGEFNFEPADGGDFVGKLSPADETSLPTDGWRNLIATGYTLHTYANERSKWYFIFHPSKGHARLKLRLE